MNHLDATPSRWITRFAHLIAPGARMLDLAAGHGRHTRYFAERGAQVLAVDRDAEALAALSGTPGIITRALDLEAGTWPLAGERFDAIVVANYLHRPLFPHLRAALAADGVLLYETFAMGNEAFGRPTNPDFLLCQDELLTVAALPPRPLTVVAFEQGFVDDDGRRAVMQRMAAVGADYPWPPAVPS
jgi:SAM-dependent methyltransferase